MPAITVAALIMALTAALRAPGAVDLAGSFLPLVPALIIAWHAMQQAQENRNAAVQVSELQAEVNRQRLALAAEQEHIVSLQTLLKAAQELGGKLEVEEILQLMPRHAASIAHAGTCLLYWLDSGSGKYLLTERFGASGNYPQFLALHEAQEMQQSGSTLRVPLVIDRQLWGTLILMDRRTTVEGRVMHSSFDAEDWGFAAIYARIAMSAIGVAFAHSEMRRMALTDSLTGIYNRQFFMQRLKEEIARAQRYHEEFSVLFFDIDHFKQFNDRWGHQAGDETLRFIAQQLRRWARQSDVYARWGGEEFVVILPRTGKEQARQAAERLRRQVAEAKTRYGSVTISVGVASFPADSQDALGLINCADEAAYQSKSGGRNRVTCYQRSSSGST